MRIARQAIRTILRADAAASPFVTACLSRGARGSGGLALDLPCGSGRHMQALSAHGFRVVAADLSAELLRAARRRGDALRSSADYIRLDAFRRLPFPDGAFDLIIVVHFFSPGLIARLSPLVKPGGRLLLETFGAHGGNVACLPKHGEVAAELHGTWSTLAGTERAAKAAPERRVVKFFGRREA